MTPKHNCERARLQSRINIKIVKVKRRIKRKPPEEDQQEDIGDREEKQKKAQRKKVWDDWWRGVTQLESPPVTLKTTVPMKKNNDKGQKHQKNNMCSIEKKKRPGRKKKSEKKDDLKQLTVKEMIDSLEVKEGQNPKLERSKKIGVVQQLKSKFENEIRRERLQWNSGAVGTGTNSSRRHNDGTQGNDDLGLGKNRVQGAKSLGRAYPEIDRSKTTTNKEEKIYLLGSGRLGFL